MKNLAIITILNGLAYFGYGVWRSIDLAEYIDSSEQWYLVVFIVLYFLSGIGSIVFGWTTRNWHDYEDAKRSSELLDLAFDEQGTELRPRGLVRIAQMAGLVGVTVLTFWLLVRFPGTLFRAEEGEGLLVIWELIRLGLSIGAMVYLVRNVNLAKIKPDAEAA